ncbi:hypothetical protein Droror1_Dr00001833 [Drosera rotundifolia]
MTYFSSDEPYFAEPLAVPKDCLSDINLFYSQIDPLFDDVFFHDDFSCEIPMLDSLVGRDEVDIVGHDEVDTRAGMEQNLWDNTGIERNHMDYTPDGILRKNSFEGELQKLSVTNDGTATCGSRFFDGRRPCQRLGGECRQQLEQGRKKRSLKQSMEQRRKCTHCEVEESPQWRQGPLGPRTLCNACGLRYMNGKLVPEYRPAASPTFDVSRHSNYYKRIKKMKENDDQHREYSIDGKLHEYKRLVI